MDAGCLDSHIPVKTDLLILEQNEDNGTGESSLHAERFLWRLNAHFRSQADARNVNLPGNGSATKWHAPPVILVNTISVTEGEKNRHCMEPTVDCDATVCPLWNYTLPVGIKFEDRYLALMQHFGYASLSMRDFYLALLHDGLLGRLQLGICQFFSVMALPDSMHPAPLGQLLLSDIVVNHLVRRGLLVW